MAEASDNQIMVPARVAHAEDRISALPDDVLCRILSPLSSREAVRTCLLARRRRDLWRSVPIINVSFAEFEDRPAEDDFEREVMFERFVNRFLLLRNPVGVDEFRLEYIVAGGTEDLNASSADANLWISHVLQRNAWDVKVVNQENPLVLVPSVFTSSFLNRLHIAGATLVPGFFNQLQVGCPALEYLLLDDCVIMDLEIFSNTLKVLVLSMEIRFSLNEGDQVSISTPSLISLSMDSSGLAAARLPILNNMLSLKTVSVLLSENIEACDAVGIRRFLGSLSHVTSLKLCFKDRKLTMEKNYRWCPTFSNLINLTLDTWCVHADFYALIVFLQNSPNLKKLNIRLEQVNVSTISGELEDVSTISGELEDRSFTCEQLEIVEIICSETNELLPRVTDFFRDSDIGPDKVHITHQK